MTNQPAQTTTTAHAPSPLPSGDAGPPALEVDASVRDVAAHAYPSEPGAHAFARDLAVWLSRLIDRPTETVRVRENPFDHRPCPRAWTYEITIAGHTVVVTAYEVPTPDGTVTRHAITLNGQPVPFVVRRPAVHLVWQLACATWRAAHHDPHTQT